MEETQGWITVVKEIFSLLTPLLLAVMSYLFTKKLNKQKKDLITRDKEKAKETEKREVQLQKFIEDTMEDVVVKLTDMEISLNAHIEDTDFRMDFKDALRTKSRQILLTLHNFLTQEHKNILNNWSDSIEKFGLDYYYSSKRKDANQNKETRKELDKDLTQLLNINIQDFYNYIDFSYEEIRTYKKKPQLFSQFVASTKIHNKTEHLKMQLVDNGFKSTEEITKVFTAYIENFFADFTNIITIWERLEILDKSSEAA